MFISGLLPHVYENINKLTGSPFSASRKRQEVFRLSFLVEISGDITNIYRKIYKSPGIVIYKERIIGHSHVCILSIQCFLQ